MIRGGGDDRFREVFDRTFPLAERVAQRVTGDSAVAEEIAAESLTRLFVRWSRLGGQPHVDAWVIRVATNLALGVVRRRGGGNSAAATPALEEEQVVLRVALAEALSRLSRRQRQVVALRYLSDLSEREVAEVLGVSPGTVKTHLHRALGVLRDRLDVPDDASVEVRLARD